jgi:hypothetical protein
MIVAPRAVVREVEETWKAARTAGRALRVEASDAEGAVYSGTQQNPGGFTMRFQTILKMAAAGTMAAAMMAVPAQMKAQGGETVLKPADVQKLLPASVYYKGQSAPTQLRNSGGVKFSDGFFVLATLVDNSGYATSVANKYQGYFIAEVPLKLGGENLAAGVYGMGFVGDKFVVTDVGGHDVLTVSAGDDAGLKRPMPLQVLADAAGGGFRLYAGRKYVIFSR